MKLTSDSRPIGILGHPIAHSLSPTIHNAAFVRTGLPYVYIACDVVEGDIEAAVRGLGALGFRGANVTLPHKNAVLAFMDELTPPAKATRAVNTIICDRTADGTVRFTGDNTDVAGFVGSLDSMRSRVDDRPALVLGAGGAARAVVYALATTLHASSITVAARDERKAQWVHEGLVDARPATVIPYSEVPSAIAESNFVINTTPLGMHPHADRTPVADPSVFTADHVVYDLIYRPRRTQLLKEAEARGAVVVDGSEMLILQAAAAFERWTGTPMPIDHVREVIGID